MLFRFSLLTTAVIGAMAKNLPAPWQVSASAEDRAAKPDPQPQEASNNTTGGVWLTFACIPTEVSCIAPNDCILQDTNGKRVFCSAPDDATIIVAGGQRIVVETVPDSDWLFFAWPQTAVKPGGRFSVQVPFDATSCALKLVRAGSVSSMSLECEFEKAAFPAFVVDTSARGEEVRAATKEEQQRWQDEAKSNPNSASKGGDQQQKTITEEQQIGQEEITNIAPTAGQKIDQQQKQQH